MTAPESLASALASRYRLDRELGQGGMATVYLAHDLKHDRDVALKVLKPKLAARRLNSSQSRVAKMEAADSTVSVDLLLRSLLRLGAKRKDIARAMA